MAASVLRLQPPRAVGVHPGGGAVHPAVRAASAEDPPTRAEAERGPKPAVGRGGGGPAAVRGPTGTVSELFCETGVYTTVRLKLTAYM